VRTFHRLARGAAVLPLLAACARRPAPETAPTPAVVVAAPETRTVPRDSTVSGLPARPAVLPETTSISRQDVTREAVSVFGDSVAADSAADTPAGEGDAEEVSWDLDVRSYETHSRVEHYVRYFSGAARERIENRLEVGSRYEPMIRAKFRAAGIPEDMYYLALIESGYDNHAYSRAAAVGMWQFMASTARGMGMRVDWWIDERRDPVRATDGATRFLRWLNEQYGSYYLAAAAYNGGPGRVSRGLTRFAADMEGESRDEQFFSLAEKDYLPRETKEYVPQLIAAALVGKAPARYGLSLSSREPFAYDSVRVGAATPLAAVAKAAGVPVGAVLELNPHVLRGATPPTGGALWLRVPVGRAEGFDAAFDALDADDRKAFRRVESRKGQTAASIARDHGLAARQLAWYNRDLAIVKKGKLRGTLRAGQVLLVPSAATVAAARDIPDPAVEKYGRAKGGAKYHVVKRGESLGLIARKNGTTVASLKRLNRLKKDMVFPGQQLLVKGSPAKSKASGTRYASSSSKSRASSRSKSKRPTTVASRASSSKLPALSTRAKSPTAKKPAVKKSTSKATSKSTTTKKKRSTSKK
jgi:membrane-bound lytic murein transglycosylase D